MAEREQVRLRESEPVQNDYERAYRERAEYIERQRINHPVIRSRDREYQQTRQGRLKYYLHPAVYQNTVLNHWTVFIHDIKRHSGSHKHQGGILIFALEGKGYTVVDGQRTDWEAGDLLLLPYKEGGVEHQHFNEEEGKSCKWLAFVFRPFSEYTGSEIVQVKESPDYSK